MSGLGTRVMRSVPSSEWRKLMPEPFRRVLLKLSGEAFGGGKLGVDPIIVASVAVPSNTDSVIPRAE